MALLGNVTMSGFSILIYYILYHYLSLTDAGKWFFFLTVLSLCDSVRNGFLSTATIKFYAGTTPERGREVLGSVWFLASAITGAVIVLNLAAYYPLANMHDTGVAVAAKWVGLTFLSSLPFSVIFWKLQADEQYDKILAVRAVNNGSTLLVFFILAVTGNMTLERALLFNFLTNCLTSLVCILWKMSHVHTIRHRSKQSITEIVNFGKYSLGTSLSSTFLGSVNNFFITFMLGPAAVAVYNLPSRLMEIVEMPLRTFVGTGLSGMAVAYNQDNMHHVKHILKKYAGMLTIAFVPLAIGGIVFADVAVHLLGGAKYLGTESANIFRCLMLLSLMYPIDRFNGATLDIIHKPQINFHKVLIMVIVMVAGDYFFVLFLQQHYGVSIGGSQPLLDKCLYGIVVASGLTTLAGVVYGYYRLNQYIGVSVPQIIRVGYSETIEFARRKLKK